MTGVARSPHLPGCQKDPAVALSEFFRPPSFGLVSLTDGLDAGFNPYAGALA